MKLGGWSRLWIVASVIYLASVIAFVLATYPQAEAIPHSDAFYDRLSPAVRKTFLDARGKSKDREALLEEARRRDLLEQVEMPNRHLLTFSKDLPEAEKQAAARSYWTVVEHAATVERNHFVLRAFAWWIGPIIALYVLGWAFDWVYRGFKRP